MRTEGQWNKKGTHLIPVDNIPIVLKNDYLNFGGLTPGDIGYGIRDSSGVMQFKNDGGAWSNIGTNVSIHTETPSGLINGVNLIYTMLNSISTVYSFAINGQFIHPSDYNFSGTDITMITALPVVLSGLPFTIIYS